MVFWPCPEALRYEVARYQVKRHKKNSSVIANRIPDQQDGNFIYETYKTLKKRKYPVEDLDRSTIAKRYPAWYASFNLDRPFSHKCAWRNSSVWNRGYFNTLAGWAESGRVVTKLAEKLRSVGVKIDQLAASEVLRNGNKITGIKFQDGSLRTAEYVTTPKAFVMVLTASVLTSSLLVPPLPCCCHTYRYERAILRACSNGLKDGNGGQWSTCVPLHTAPQTSAFVPQRAIPSVLLRYHRDWLLRLSTSSKWRPHQDW